MLFITGGTGTIGGPLVDGLAHDSLPSLLLARERPVDAAVGIRVIQGDIRQREGLGMTVEEAAFVREHATTIIHAAAQTRFDASLEVARQVNVEGTRNVLEFAAD